MESKTLPHSLGSCPHQFSPLFDLGFLFQSQESESGGEQDLPRSQRTCDKELCLKTLQGPRRGWEKAQEGNPPLSHHQELVSLFLSRWLCF